MTLLEQVFAQVRAEEARTARDEGSRHSGR
jgi:hypothetical protein